MGGERGGNRPHPESSRQAPPRLNDNLEELTPRPIIKEEELSRMVEISNDMGWAIQDEVDYNKTLAFSDDECDTSNKTASSRSGENRDSRERDNV